jgi:hypothetical protein
MSEQPFGTKACDVPGYQDCWVQFKTSGYPRKLRREWVAADAEQTWAILMRYTLAWSLRDLSGAAVPLPDTDRPMALLDDVEEAVAAWIVRAFTEFWLKDLSSPRPNS